MSIPIHILYYYYRMWIRIKFVNPFLSYIRSLVNIDEPSYDSLFASISKGLWHFDQFLSETLI